MDSLHIKNFINVNNSCRRSLTCGGTSILNNSSISMKAIDLGIPSIDQTFEYCAASFNVDDYKYIVISMYHTECKINSNYDLFLTNLDALLTKVSSKYDFIILGADFNVDHLEIVKLSPKCTKLLDIMSSYDLKRTVNEPTRYSKYGNSLIDNIFTNIPCGNAKVLNTGLSDHLGCIVSMPVNLAKKPSTFLIKKRVFNEINRQQFIHLISRVQWTQVFQYEETDMAFMAFDEIFKFCFEKSFPIEIIRKKSKSKKKQKFHDSRNY